MKNFIVSVRFSVTFDMLVAGAICTALADDRRTPPTNRRDWIGDVRCALSDYGDSMPAYVEDVEEGMRCDFVKAAAKLFGR